MLLVLVFVSLHFFGTYGGPRTACEGCCGGVMAAFEPGEYIFSQGPRPRPLLPVAYTTPPTLHRSTRPQHGLDRLWRHPLRTQNMHLTNLR